jgi:hypothetical protein
MKQIRTFRLQSIPDIPEPTYVINRDGYDTGLRIKQTAANTKMYQHFGLPVDLPKPRYSLNLSSDLQELFVIANRTMIKQEQTK